MKILVIGTADNFEECRQKFGAHECTHLENYDESGDALTKHEVTFDFSIGNNVERFRHYARTPASVFVNTCNITLAALVSDIQAPLQCGVFGFNGFPSLFNREVLEVSLLAPDDIHALGRICEKLDTKYLTVDDRIGMVTPRVVCMIINEAFYTVQEGTATREGIDLAMKLGTNYPYGPFEWCGRIGLANVYQLLCALHADTGDERYKISALMKKEYLRLKRGPTTL